MTARTHVILGDEVVDAIDQLVGQRGRSRFLDQAAREKLERLELEHALASTAGVLKTKDYPELEDQASINEWVRAQRGSEGRYQADFASKGRTIHTPDALIAGTARAHGAVLLTHNFDDFPTSDLRVEIPVATDG